MKLAVMCLRIRGARKGVLLWFGASVAVALFGIAGISLRGIKFINNLVSSVVVWLKKPLLVVMAHLRNQ